MQLYLASFLGLFVLLVSCKKQYTKDELKHIESMQIEEVYTYERPDSTFIFCLDTIKASFEYDKLFEEYCKQGQKPSYVYLPSYNVYLPIIIHFYCNEIIACGIKRHSLDLFVNRDLDWLIDYEPYIKNNQDSLNAILLSYYKSKYDNHEIQSK